MIANPNKRASSIQLFSFPTSPYGIKVACYLAYLKLDYQFVGVSPITFEQVKFTGERQVPALKIGEEWKLDSQAIGLWLEETFPGSQLLGASATDREEILAVDNWVSHQLIPNLFRILVDWPSFITGLNNGWKLGHAVNQATPIPTWVRFMWPVFVRKAKFIVAMVNNLDRQKSLQQSQDKMVIDFVDLLKGGPFLGGRAHPTLADFSAFAIIVFPYKFGLQGDANWVDNRLVLKWINAVQQHMPDNPFLVDDSSLPNALPAPA